ncbi:MAG: FAD-binding protein, partial [Acidobacteria bacterium]|nr:FAD-binding protein [Acidobacteriota bacterium]
EGPRLVREILIGKAGIRFDHQPGGDIEYGLEGAHSRRRILHVGDLTGQAIMTALLRRIAAAPNVEVLTGHTAVDLLTFPHHSRDPLAVYHSPGCHGVYAFVQATRRVEPILARHTILATGGLGQIFLNTTNAPGARGDGLAMAYRAGARVVNAEYIQFHPTALHMPGHTKSLISEAVRGEGGVLLTPKGERFMEGYAPEELELAPRDVVARAIYTEMVEGDLPYVLLDIASKRPAQFIRERFPRIHSLCLEQGIDVTRQPIPVVPAAHYFCGGVLVDLRGRTTLLGLYAVGEVACTGVHGANRLASTSLLEGLVWGARAAVDIRGQKDTPGIRGEDAPPWEEEGLTYEVDPALIQGDNQNIRNLMWHYVGLVRNSYRLNRALRELRNLWLNIEEFYKKAYLTDDLIGLRNTVLNALIVTRSALENPVSRGCHYREDGRTPPGAAPPSETNDLGRRG